MFALAMTAPSEEKAAVIALVRSGARPWHHYSELVEAADSAISVLTGEVDDADELVPRLFIPDAMTSPPDLEAIGREIGAWESEGIRVLTVLDDEYPVNLRTIHNRPPLLFVRGRLSPSDVRSIAVVGTRKSSGGGADAARAMARQLASAGFVVVSGLAAGIDTAAHQAALDSGHRTIAVIGTGLRKAYPKENAELQRRIATEGAVISQFWPDAPPNRAHFPMRNVVMSGIALATVVVEAGNTSGARMQARFALEHGRPVFLVRALLEHEWAQQYATRPGTYIVDDAADVIAHMDRLTSFDALFA
jgi:DNA processing protein